MRKVFLGVCAALVALAVFTPAAMSAPWYDDFESYAQNAPVPNPPWQPGTLGGLNVSQEYAGQGHNALGYYGYAPNQICKCSFRPITVTKAGSVSAMIRWATGGDTRFGLFTGKQGGSIGEARDYTDSAFFDLYATDGTVTPKKLVGNLYEGGTHPYGAGAVRRFVDSGTDTIAKDVWTDVKLSWTADFKTFTYEYKPVSSGTWKLLGTMSRTTPAPFVYVGCSAGGVNYGMIDTVRFSEVPEPSSLVALCVGLTALCGSVRRFRRR